MKRKKILAVLCVLLAGVCIMGIAKAQTRVHGQDIVPGQQIPRKRYRMWPYQTDRRSGMNLQRHTIQTRLEP